MHIQATVPIPQYIEIGKLIGRKGRNLKPIAETTGTFIYVNTNTKPAQIEIKIRKHNNASSLPSSGNRINEAKDQLNDLIKNLEKERKNTVILIPKHIEIGRLIGREGCNLNPITERTGTSIDIITNTNPAQIKIRKHYNTNSLPPSENQINKAKNQLNGLLKNLEKEIKNTVILIPKHIKIGKLIGREGRNLKPIAERTGTLIYVNTNTNPAQIEIKIRKHDNDD